MTTATAITYEIRAIWHGGRRAADDGGPTRESAPIFGERDDHTRTPDAYGIWRRTGPEMSDLDMDPIREYPMAPGEPAPNVWADLKTLEADEPIRTAAQDASIQQLYNRNPDGSANLHEFAARWRWEWNRPPTDCLLAVYVGITVGIEPDGYTHS